ncbi:MAG TPA: TonB-dependent receptor [Phnomibacter sp.]|nr:TonB-dependent receptor [Phnomibacter sp.]
MLRKLCQLIAVIAFALVSNTVMSQVTTSSITGTVKDPKGQLLEGATIKAEHQPSGTVYSTFSTKGGTFTLPGLRTGGPYKVEITYTGFAPAVFEGITLQLGEIFNVVAGLKENESVLENVVVSGSRKKAAVDKTGAATNINNRVITTMPSISRSLSDFTRLTPQSNGNSFGGRDNRYNNIQVDGANLNNNFGISSDPLPGGGNQPISLDAIDEVSINIAPYDVRQSGFTGAGINAITKSGTNKLKGSAYTYFRNESFNGARVGDVKLGAQQATKSNIFGATLGGAILKNKLFFFGSYEYESRTFAGIQWSPKGGSGSGNVSNVSADTLKRLSDFLRNTYGYETGAYDNFPNFGAENSKILGRIDWNISNNHKVTAKYSILKSNNDVALNSTSSPNGAQTGLQARFGINGMSYANSNYGFEDIVKNGTFELNSRFSNKFSNQLLATITNISAIRTSPSSLFPFIDIRNATGAGITTSNMSAGFEPFSYNNEVVNDIYSVVDNFTYYAGKHTLTGGVSYEYQEIGNMFMPGSQSYYVYNSLQDFISNKAPAVFSTTYSLVPGKSAVYASQVKVGQLGFYAQDEWIVSPKFKLTAGIRFDKFSFPETPLENKAISALWLYDKNGKQVHYNNTVLPTTKIYTSPRVGFRYDVLGDKSTIVRGGTGLFTGRMPFVWLTNITQNSGMYQFAATIKNAADLERFKFNPDPTYHIKRGDPLLPTTAGTSVPTNLVFSDPEFRFPQVWRTNVAVDKDLGKGWLLTLEGVFGKDINAVYMRNANQKPFNGTTTGVDVRPRFLAAADRGLNPSTVLTNAIVLENAKKGEQMSLTAQVTKSFTNGWSAMAAYTYTHATDITTNPGSTAGSVWSGNPAIGGQNAQEYGSSRDALPHRFIATASYRHEYLKHLATTVALYYEASNQGRFSYVVNGDLNNDGNSGSDLLFVPTKASDLIFVSATYGTNTFTPAQQADAFEKYISQDKYLDKTRGAYAERNGALLPWYHRLDFKLTQDVFTNIGKTKNTLQFTADIFNFANMLNRDWGIRQFVIQNQPLVAAGINAAGVPTYKMNAASNNQLLTKTFDNTISTASTWSMQLGFRYIFN